jgi:thiol-disulfide isomerase/thioredoxin
MKNNIKLFLLLTFYTINVWGQNERKENVVELRMDTVFNTDLQLRIAYEDKNLDLKVLRIPGQLEKNTWKFCFPDSIYDHINTMSLASPMKNDSIEDDISLGFISGNDTLRCGSFNFKNNHSISILNFLTHSTIPNILYSDKKTGEGKFKTLYIDAYTIEETNDLELLSSIEGLKYIGDFYNEKIKHEDYVQKFIQLAKEYPKSNSLIVMLASYMTFYKSKEDVAKIYNCFSDEAKQTHYGKKIDRYLTQTSFVNDTLPAWDTEKPEPVIKDNTKYNLIAFSASWCAPCHEMIPVLKQIYNDLQDEINIVYVSIDEDKTVKLWKELMRTEKIPWRSVLAKDRISLIRDKYTVLAIPCVLLVNPNNEIKRMNLMDEKERSGLYKLFNKQVQ